MHLRRFWLVFLVLVIGSVLQQGWYWQQLPSRIAVHFGSDGRPDHWMPKTEATLLMLSLQIGIPFFLLMLGALGERRPEWWFNLPNQAHWLSEANRARTIELMGTTMAWIAIVTAIFLGASAHLTFVANESQVALDLISYLPLLAIYVATVLALAIRNYRHFVA